MLSDPQFWVALAFIVFILIIINPIRKILSSSLDAKIHEIKNSIDESENLKNDAQITLTNLKKRQNEVKIEINEIEINAKQKIKTLEIESRKKLNDQISKRELQTKEKIDQIIRDANVTIQKNITKTSIEALLDILEKKLNKEEKQNLINQSIKDLRSILKN